MAHESIKVPSSKRLIDILTEKKSGGIEVGCQLDRCSACLGLLSPSLLLQQGGSSSQSLLSRRRTSKPSDRHRLNASWTLANQETLHWRRPCGKRAERSS
jgi:hypothetical protein